MAARALVHKQFNSPLGLYSENNITETLNRELKTLSNGTMGIDFTNDPAATKPISKPANLANSAVLRMLEEQEEQRRQGVDPGFRTVAWPPPNETHFVPKASTPAPTSSNGPQQYSSQGPATPQYQRAPSQTRGASVTRQYQPPSYQGGYQQQQQPSTAYPQQHQPQQQPQYEAPQQMSQRQPAWRQNSVPSYTQTPAHQPQGEELQYKQNYPQGTPVYQQDSYHNPPAYEQQQPQQQQYQQPTYASQKPVPARGNLPTTVSFSGGLPANKPVPKPNTDYYWTQQQYFYNNDDDRTINQGGRGGSLQRNPQQQEMMQSRPQYNSQSSLAQTQGYGQQQQHQPQQGAYGGPQQYQPQQQQAPQSARPRWAAAPQNQQQQPQPVYTSYQNNNQQPAYNAPSNDPPAPQYPASVSYQSTAYNQPPAYTPQAVAPQQYQAQQPQQQQYHPQPAGYGQPTMASVAAPQQQQQYQPITQRQPSPSSGMVTLRQSTPVSQKPAPVYQSQPPVSSFNGGAHMRGDMKWPPEECKQQAAKENEERLRLAAGPACRPRRVNKDYGSFFARHALNNTYPGYRVPPGTQHYPHEM